MASALVPDHVPPELIFDFDYVEATDNVEDPYKNMMALDERGAPDFFYTPRYGGHWVARRYDDIFTIFRDPERFAVYPNGIPPYKDGEWRMLPFEYDPPELGRYRTILGPLFTPMATKRLEGLIRQTAVELIDGFIDRGEADFVEVMAAKFPPILFLKFMDMPLDRVTEFVQWNEDILSRSPEKQVIANQNVMTYITDFVDTKIAQPVGEDWMSFLARAKNPDGSTALNREELLSAAYFLMLAGLDTVKNSMAHTWRYLGNHPEVQARIVAEPELIPSFVEEMLRFHGLTNNNRTVRLDTSLGDIELKKGDVILTLQAIANREDGKFPDAKKVDIEREQNVHLSFGSGAHRCLGSNIARAELRVAVEEWFKRIPSFKIKEGARIRSCGGTTNGLDSLPIIWGAAK